MRQGGMNVGPMADVGSSEGSCGGRRKGRWVTGIDSSLAPSQGHDEEIYKGLEEILQGLLTTIQRHEVTLSTILIFRREVLLRCRDFNKKGGR